MSKGPEVGSEGTATVTSKSRWRHGWFLLSAAREGPVPGICPRPVDGSSSLYNVSPLCVSLSKFPTSIRMPVIMDLEPILTTSF